MVNELAEIVDQTQERSQLVQVLWHRPVNHCFDFIGVRSDLVATHNVPQKLHFCSIEGAFGKFGVQLVLVHLCKDLLQV